MAFLAFGLHFGQISNPAAHELIHRGSRRDAGPLGAAVYVTLLFGQHASAHRLVHHRHVASPMTRTPPGGRKLLPLRPPRLDRAFRAGLAAERRTAGRLHPYAVYLGGAAGCLVLSLGIAGLAGLARLCRARPPRNRPDPAVGLCPALRPDPRPAPDGRPEPVGHRHSWNAPPVFQRGDDAERAAPFRPPRPPLAPLSRAAPAAGCADLPRSLPMMANIALVPPLWRRMMHPRLDRLAARSRQSEGPTSGGAPSDLAV